MSEVDGRWSEQDWRTVRLGPLWVLSALVGRCRFDDAERSALWDCVTDVAVTSSGLTRQVVEAMVSERHWVFEEFELDERPVVSGLLDVTAVLQKVGGSSAAQVRQAILRVGWLFAQARGPFGKTVTLQDEQQLLLLEQLLATEDETGRDNPLNSYQAI